jgi:hypothetical protein
MVIRKQAVSCAQFFSIFLVIFSIEYMVFLKYHFKLLKNVLYSLLFAHCVSVAFIYIFFIYGLEHIKNPQSAFFNLCSNVYDDMCQG